MNEAICSFRPIKEFVHTSKNGKTKCGRYHQSWWRIEKGKYIVGAYIEGNFNDLINEGSTEEEILDKCLVCLNNQELHKIKKNKQEKIIYKYGYLEKFRHIFKRDANNNFYIEVLLKTSEKKNKNFWNEGYEQT